ncbi:Uncharacterised protein [Serratia marcescens]|nr:Uncharacterised protein [Serratia marcescens]CAI0810376.1 Uncharacterised protein [Serratia marcescens]
MGKLLHGFLGGNAADYLRMQIKTGDGKSLGIVVQV